MIYCCVCVTKMKTIRMIMTDWVSGQTIAVELAQEVGNQMSLEHRT